MLDFFIYIGKCMLAVISSASGYNPEGYDGTDMFIGTVAIFGLLLLIYLIQRIVGNKRKSKKNSTMNQFEDNHHNTSNEEILHPEYIDEETYQSNYCEEKEEDKSE